MPQSLAEVYIHLIYSTKGRIPFLRDRDLRNELHGYLVGTFAGHGSPSLRTGGVEDHVHVLCRLGRTSSIADLVRDAKRASTKWIKNRSPQLDAFQWQSGYAAFSISPSHVEALKHYIANQEEHHKTESFQDELRRICGIYGVELDEEHAWD
jgi:putative transposase